MHAFKSHLISYILHPILHITSFMLKLSLKKTIIMLWTYYQDLVGKGSFSPINLMT